MKITHVISDSNVGGAGILLSSLVDGLKNDFEFEIITPINSLLTARLPKSVKVTQLPIIPDCSFSRSDVSVFREHFKANPPDVLHTHASLSARLGGRFSGIKRCISTRHCAYPAASVTKMRGAKRMLYEFSTDLTVSTADFATDNLIKSGLKKEKIKTIKNGSRDLAKEKCVDNFSIYEKLNIPEERKIVGSVARLEKIKGQDVLLRAAKEVLKFFPDTHFLFIGIGSYEKEYKNLAARLGISENVTFTGYVSSPFLYQKHFYINVNSSRGTETSSLATSECMSLSIPTVASSFGGNTEMIRHRANGLIFKTDNVFSLTSALLELLENEALYASLCIGARKSYEESFSLARMTDEYKKLYISL